VRAPLVALVLLLGAGLSGCAAAAAAAGAPVGHAELQLVGDWAAEPSANGDGVVDMTVTRAADDGADFDGDLTFAIAGARSTEPVHAAMTPNGHLVAEIGSDASLELHIVDPATLDYCFSRYGTDFVYRCGTLVRAD
jgi:hypothetical protein